MPVKLYFTTGISNWLCVNSDSVDTQQPITRARGVWVSYLGRSSPPGKTNHQKEHLELNYLFMKPPVVEALHNNM